MVSPCSFTPPPPGPVVWRRVLFLSLVALERCGLLSFLCGLFPELQSRGTGSDERAHICLRHWLNHWNAIIHQVTFLKKNILFLEQITMYLYTGNNVDVPKYGIYSPTSTSNRHRFSTKGQINPSILRTWNKTQEINKPKLRCIVCFTKQHKLSLQISLILLLPQLRFASCTICATDCWLNWWELQLAVNKRADGVWEWTPATVEGIVCHTECLRTRRRVMETSRWRKIKSGLPTQECYSVHFNCEP